MSDNRTTNGIGWPGALFITFLVLKLTHVIAWSWLWVSAPLWIPFAFVGAIFVIALVIAALTVKR